MVVGASEAVDCRLFMYWAKLFKQAVGVTLVVTLILLKGLFLPVLLAYSCIRWFHLVSVHTVGGHTVNVDWSAESANSSVRTQKLTVECEKVHVSARVTPVKVGLS